jgi:hypothetical protein
LRQRSGGGETQDFAAALPRRQIVLQLSNQGGAGFARGEGPVEQVEKGGRAKQLQTGLVRPYNAQPVAVPQKAGGLLLFEIFECRRFGLSHYARNSPPTWHRSAMQPIRHN